MITLVEGKVELTTNKFVVVSAGGVGYKIFVSAETWRKIPQKGQVVKLWTHLHVREDALDLYGFLNLAELQLFETLISVSGVGPKTALGVLAVGSLDNLRRAIASGDASFLTSVSGIGKKTAERIVVELKDRMAGGTLVDSPELREEADALEALVSLGYSRREAQEAFSKISPDIIGAERRVKEALKKLAKGK